MQVNQQRWLPIGSIFVSLSLSVIADCEVDFFFMEVGVELGCLSKTPKTCQDLFFFWLPKCLTLGTSEVGGCGPRRHASADADGNSGTSQSAERASTGFTKSPCPVGKDKIVIPFSWAKRSIAIFSET